MGRLRSSTAQAVATGAVNFKSLEDMIRFNHADDLEVELTKQNDLANETCDKTTLLHVACNVGNIDSIECLINHGAKGDVRDANGKTPLDLAYMNNHQKAAILMLEQCVDATFTPGDVITERWYGDVYETVKNCGRSLLLWSAKLGSYDAMKVLLETHKVDPNLSNDQGITALHTACSYNREDLISLLVKHGGSMHCRDYHGNVPLDKCKSSIKGKNNANTTDPNGAKSLFAQKIYGTIYPLHHAIRNKDSLDCIDKILSTPDKEQTVVLSTRALGIHKQSHRNNVFASSSSTGKATAPCVIMLTTIDFNSETPLMLACKTGVLAIVQVIINHYLTCPLCKASYATVDVINMLDQNHDTALMHSVTNGYHGIVKYLCSSFPIAPVIDYNSHSPGMSPHTISLESLGGSLRPTLNIQLCKVFYRETPLHVACRLNYIDIAKTLCSYGASVTQQMFPQYTPGINYTAMEYPHLTYDVVDICTKLSKHTPNWHRRKAFLLSLAGSGYTQYYTNKDNTDSTSNSTNNNSTNNNNNNNNNSNSGNNNNNNNNNDSTKINVAIQKNNAVNNVLCNLELCRYIMSFL